MTKRFEKLSWVLDHEFGIEWSSTIEPDMDWDDAGTYAANMGGRLPTIQELLSLVKYDRTNPAIDTDLFPATKPNWYWTSTPRSGLEHEKFCVSFNGGCTMARDKVGLNSVRIVREIRKING